MNDYPQARAWSLLWCWILMKEKGKSSLIEIAKQAQQDHPLISVLSLALRTIFRHSSHLQEDQRRQSLSPVPWRAACRINKHLFCNLKNLELLNQSMLSVVKVMKMGNQHKVYSVENNHLGRSSLWTRDLQNLRIIMSSLKKKISFRKTQRNLLINNLSNRGYWANI